MKQNLTEMVFVLDRSGSMQGKEQDVIGGFNSMIAKQKKLDGEAFVTTVLFDDCYELLHDHCNLKEVQEMTTEYFVCGCTALLDAVGKTIDGVGKRLAETPEEERPEKVLFIIMTDGLENASREYTLEKVKGMIEHQKSKYSWMFLFLGANIDAVHEAVSMGIDAYNARQFETDSEGIERTMKSVDTYSRVMRYVPRCECDSYQLLLRTCIEDMDFSVRVYNILKRAGIHTVEDLCGCTAAEILKFKHAGESALKEITEKIETYGLSLAPDEE